MTYETLPNGAVRCQDDPGEPGYGVLSRRISVAPSEAEALTEYANGLTVVEVGTGLGMSTRALLASAKALVTVDIDPWVHEHVWPALPRTSHLVFATTASEVPSGSADLVFIDGLHVPEAVRADIGEALRILKPGGRILFHDINIPWVRAEILGRFQRVDEVLPNLGLVTP